MTIIFKHHLMKNGDHPLKKNADYLCFIQIYYFDTQRGIFVHLVSFSVKYENNEEFF